MKKTMLQTAIEALHATKVLAYVDGLYSEKMVPQSKLGQEVRRLGLAIDDQGKTWDVAIGAHRRSGADGWHMAIVRIPFK